jgi:hypothetical protein
MFIFKSETESLPSTKQRHNCNILGIKMKTEECGVVDKVLSRLPALFLQVNFYVWQR